MNEKLSERLINAADDGDNLGVNEHTVDTALLREAAAIVRAFEDAPDGIIDSVGDDDDGIPRFRVVSTREAISAIAMNPLGKRVKLVEAVVA